MCPYRHRFLLTTGLCLLLLGAQSVAFAQNAEAGKELKVRELLNLTSGGDFGKQFIDAMRQQFEQQREMGIPLPDIFIERFIEVADPEELLDKAVELWLEHLDDDTIEAGLTFFRSEGGKKWAAAQAKVLPQFTAISQEWGQQLAMEVMADPAVMKELMGGLDLEGLEDMEDFEFADEDEEGDASSSIAANETAAIGTLRTLVTSEAQFQSAAIVDQDRDGTGEYGYLAELAGTSEFRTQSGRSKQGVSPAFITSVLGRTARDGEGIATKAGYHFVIYLPTGSDAALREAGEVPSGNQANADSQERSFVCYAWPVEIGTTGNRAFVVNQQGEVFSTANRDEQSYSGTDNIPPVEAAFHKELSESSRNANGTLVTAEGAGDDHLWLPAGN